MKFSSSRIVAVSLLLATPFLVAQDATPDSQPEDQARPAEVEAKPQVISLARATIKVTVPGEWKIKPTRSSIIEQELEIPPTKGDKNPGRLTMMSALGSVEANVERWIGQFSQPDGKPTSERTKVVDRKVHDRDVKIVTITGDYKESIGPPRLGKVELRPKYRMLGAIVQTEKQGQYFFKAYGPDKTMAEAEKSFLRMIESIDFP